MWQAPRRALAQCRVSETRLHVLELEHTGEEGKVCSLDPCWSILLVTSLVDRRRHVLYDAIRRNKVETIRKAVSARGPEKVDRHSAHPTLPHVVLVTQTEQ